MTDPRTPVLRRKPSPGLTGADLEQAKADAALTAANKAHQTATTETTRLFPSGRAWDRLFASGKQGADAAANLKNLVLARLGLSP